MVTLGKFVTSPWLVLRSRGLEESRRATTRFKTDMEHSPQRQERTMHHCTVKTILGVSEIDLVQLSSADRRTFVTPRNDDEDGGCFVHRVTGHCTPFGHFEVVNIAELRRRVEAMTSERVSCHGEGRQAIPLASSGQRQSPRLTIQSGVDIGQLQSTLRTEDHAMVQVASNFNCLENPSVSTAADCGYLVDNACRDSTQGPAAVFGPLSAYLYRAHFVEVGDDDSPDHDGQHSPQQQLGQTKARGINLLQGVAQYFATPVNGKLLLQGNETPVLDMDAVAQQVCVGLHTNAPVMFSRGIGGKAPVPIQKTDTATIDQVFSASINMHSFGHMSRACLDHCQGDREEAADHMARTLLHAAYEGLYLAAIVQERRQLYLTLVGGGSFGNRIELILEELERAHNKWADHRASRLELCQICVFSKGQEQEVNSYFGYGAN